MTDLPPPPGPWHPPASGPTLPGSVPPGVVPPVPAAAPPTLPPTAPPPVAPPPPVPTPPGSPIPGAASADPPTVVMPRPPFATGGPAAGGPERRSRVPAIVGALVAIAVGAGAVLWLTRGGDDAGDAGETEQTERTEQTEETDGGDGTAPAGTDAAPTTAADTAGTVADTTPATTTPLVLPTTVAPPTTDASLAVVDIPPGATIHSDPSGWTIALDPAWTVSPDATAWFTGTGTPDFQDNVNVAVEVLPQAVTLDEYVVAAIGQIQVQAADFQLVDQRRVVGADGVEVEIIGWSGTFTGLPTLAFVQAVTVTPTNAYIATFTSVPDRMPGLAATIGPYLTTIRGT